MPRNDKAVTLLLVEDEFLIRTDIAGELRDMGFTVFEASHADEAIQILEVHTDIHLVFTDVDMPGSIDGLKLAALVRDRWPPIKLIVTSGHRAIEESRLPKGGRFFSKPYEVRDIINAIVELIAAEAG